MLQYGLGEIAFILKDKVKAYNKSKGISRLKLRDWTDR
jgi:hypothetical protein